MANYKETLQPLIDSNLLLAGEVYDYQNDPLHEDFQQFFDFCTENLEIHQDEYHIIPSHFYYANNYEINACAYQISGHKFIAVNMGAIDQVRAFYEGQITAFDLPGIEHYKAIATHKNIFVSDLLFQYTTLYFYYHELGHLIQHNNNPDAFSIKENLIADEDINDVLHQHVLEFDADWFASGQLAFHLVDFYKDQDGILNPSIENLSDLISLGLSAIFNYYVFTAHQFPEIYYQEKSHPHPVVRISYVLTFIMNTFAPNLPEGFKLNLHAVLANAIKLSEHLLLSSFGNPVMNFAGLFLQEGENIEAYINTIIEAAENYPELSRYKLISQ